MEHTMKLFSSNFEDLKSGSMKREYRLLDEKRKLVRVGDTIVFQKLPDLDEEFIVDVKNVEVFDNWHDCYAKYFDEDFKDKYANVDEVVKDTYEGGYYTEEESKSHGCVVFTISKRRIAHLSSAACYLKKDDQVLMLKYDKKWGKVFTPPGGKFESGESPLDCIIREFKEETGLRLINPHLQGISYWHDSYEGVIYIFVCHDFEGKMQESQEGTLEWISINDLPNINQFDQNKKFTNYLFKDEIFEGKFNLDNSCNVLDYEIRTM